jgi:hypothetical protein
MIAQLTFAWFLDRLKELPSFNQINAEFQLVKNGLKKN